MWPLVARWAMDINTNPDCSRPMDLVMVLGSNLGLGVTMVPGESTGHPDWHGPHSSMALGYQHGPRCQPRFLALAQSSMVSGATYINIAPEWSRVMDPDMALDCSSGPDSIMTPTDSTGHTNQPGTSFRTSLVHQCDHRLWPRSWKSMWALAAT